MIQNILISSAISLAIGFGAGWSSKGWYEDSKTLEVEKQAKVVEDKKEEQVAVISDSNEKQKEEARVVYRTRVKTIEKIVEKPVYLNQCFEEEGLNEINEALK